MPSHRFKAVPGAVMILATLGACTNAELDRHASQGAAPSPSATTAIGNTPLPEQLVQDLHTAFGDHHARAVHAKGVILTGHFVPDPEAKTLCYAKVFDAPIPVVVRFSDFTGIPTISDTSPAANPRGFAIKFQMPDGSNFDIVSHSFNGFPVARADEFGAFLRAVGASGPGTRKPTPLDIYLDAHPIAKAFLTTQKPPPESYATAAFYGVNAFQFSNGGGHSSFVRYRFAPAAGEHYLSEAALTQKPANYLIDEIVARVQRSPIVFTWYAQVSDDGDAIENPSIAWPESRRLVKLGQIVIDHVDPPAPAADKSLLFLPGTLPPGIGIADPMVTVRNATYPKSFHERQ